ncbi:hypothetical protein ACOMHN_002019 [Nucella lapillus]
MAGTNQRAGLGGHHGARWSGSGVCSAVAVFITSALTTLLTGRLLRLALSYGIGMKDRIAMKMDKHGFFFPTTFPSHSEPPDCFQAPMHPLPSSVTFIF